ncbi:MAG: hypothetical protein RM368_05795 [Nostoc sp. DedSLP03]|uniref:hypothetical protein n=1 Tax=Nostoc sp. DedSLP03 TaxID=3075400 RepID=UPI002AD219FC|nr:hypothetical protein [Nostoc sp. DedSLP03]MDZ7964473.1 hypothetical protein [Nostoc sp. DedSLP03]
MLFEVFAQSIRYLPKYAADGNKAMERVMITEEDLAQQFNVIIEHTHPRVWKLLSQCYVKIINPHPHLTRVNIKTCIRHTKYIGIYCPDRLIGAVVE